MARQMSFYSTLTSEEKSRMQPCMRARWYVSFPKISTARLGARRMARDIPSPKEFRRVELQP